MSEEEAEDSTMELNCCYNKITAGTGNRPNNGHCDL